MSDPRQILGILFWVSLLLLIYNYSGTYLSLLILRLLQRKSKSLKTKHAANQLSVTIIVPAYNEEEVIGEKIENLLQQDYPPDLIEIIVASDCSSDRTNEIVASFTEQNVALRKFSERHGKFGMIDEMIPQIISEIVVITDANVKLASYAITKMMLYYRDSTVGAVSGDLKTVFPEGREKLRGESKYRGFENILKRLMSRTGSLLGVFGGFYSIRQKLFRPIGTLPVHDDIVIPLEVSAQGYKVVHAVEAHSVEETQPDITDEFRRRIRMGCFNLNTVPRMLKLSWRAGITMFYLAVSYKLLRWFSPYLFLILAISTAMLYRTSIFYSLFAMMMAFGMFLALIGLIKISFSGRGGLVSDIYLFVVMNIAVIIGFGYWLKGAKGYWETRGR